jgi:hypothetical protein
VGTPANKPLTDRSRLTVVLAAIALAHVLRPAAHGDGLPVLGRLVYRLYTLHP